MISAFIFDMDGTLIDTEILWVELIEAYLRERGCPVTPEEALEVVYGIACHEVYAEMLRRWPSLGMTVQELSDTLLPRFLQLRTERDVLIPSSVALLRRLAEDYPVCIVSGSDETAVQHGIAVMGVADTLAFHLSGDHYAPGKPDPVCFRMAADRLNLPPSKCVVFEDSTVGMQAAKAAGMLCVALARPGRPPQDVSMADLVLSDLGDFDAAALG